MKAQGKTDFLLKMLCFTGALMSMVFSLAGLIGGVLFILKILGVF